MLRAQINFLPLKKKKKGKKKDKGENLFQFMQSKRK